MPSNKVCNDVKYGFILSPLEDGQTIEDDDTQLTNVRLEASVDFPPMDAHPLLDAYVKPSSKSKLGFSEIFLINLQRRPDRRNRMQWALSELGLDHKLFNAVDGK